MCVNRGFFSSISISISEKEYPLPRAHKALTLPADSMLKKAKPQALTPHHIDFPESRGIIKTCFPVFILIISSELWHSE
jgi:hypothetical protein